MEHCRYFTWCKNETEFVITHPILGEVRCCRRCAEVVGLTEKLHRPA